MKQVESDLGGSALRRASSVRIAACLLPLALATTARADVTEQCLRSFEQAQVDRDAAKLLASRGSFASCARPVCPVAVQRECRAGLSELRTRIPTLSLRVRGVDGSDVKGATLTIDGTDGERRLNGEAVEVDPGERVLRLQAAGHAPDTLTLVVREGERARFVDAVLEPLNSPEIVPQRAPQHSRGRALPAGFWISGGIGVAGLAAFAVLGVGVRRDNARLERECAPTCSDREVTALEHRAWLANGSAAVGAAGLGLATWLFLRHERTPNSGRSMSRVQLAPFSARAPAGVRVTCAF